jgi:plastocyanin
MPRLAILVFVSLFAASALAHELSGTVEVTLKGDKKKEDLSSVVVYLDQIKDDPAVPASQLKKEFLMETRNKQLTPRVLAVPVGSTVSFPNFDPIFHNLFSVSRPNDFDLGLYKGGTSKSKTFTVPGVIRVYCNVHPQMTATIIVANSGFYTVAGKSGSYSLGQVPPGSFMLRAYSEEGQTEQKIDMGNSSLNVKLTIDAKNFKKIKHKNKFGKDYPTDENERY